MKTKVFKNKLKHFLKSDVTVLFVDHLDLQEGTTACKHSTDTRHETWTRVHYVSPTLTEKVIDSGSLVENHFNQQHIGCVDRLATVRYSGSGFVLYSSNWGDTEPEYFLACINKKVLTKTLLSNILKVR